MGLKRSYTLLAPLYDPLVQAATRSARQRSLARLNGFKGSLLMPGFGTGLDVDFLPAEATITAQDLTPAMLDRAKERASSTDLNIHWQVGDAQALSWGDEQFDAVAMHLILAVVPNPQAALCEAARVLKPGGRLLILDKFLSPHARAPLRRALSPLMGAIATRTDVVFEELLEQVPSLELVENSAAAVGGWFRQIEAHKK